MRTLFHGVKYDFGRTKANSVKTHPNQLIMRYSGLAILALYVLTCLVANLSVSHLTANPARFRYGIFVAMGFVVSQLMVGLTVSIYGGGRADRRLLFFVATLCFTGSGILLGELIELPTNESLNAGIIGRQCLDIFAAIAPLLLGFSIPMVGLRWARFRLQWFRTESVPVSTGGQFSIFQVIMLTTMLAMFVGLIETQRPDRSRWVIAAITGSVGFGAQIICLPIMAGIFRLRRPIIWQTFAFAGVVLIPFVTGILVEYFGSNKKTWIPSRRGTFEVCVFVLTISQLYFWVLIAIRWLGTEWRSTPRNRVG